MYKSVGLFDVGFNVRRHKLILDYLDINYQSHFMDFTHCVICGSEQYIVKIKQ